MTLMTKILAGGAGLAALAAAAPAAAQYGYGYGYGPSPYASPYAQHATTMATQRCAAAVQNRLARRTGMTGIFGALLGAQASTGRVVAVTQVVPRRSTVRVRGLATSGQMAGYGPYGAGAYGALGYGYQPDLTFRCDVDYRGFVRDVDIFRR